MFKEIQAFLYPTKCLVCGQRLQNQEAEICNLCYNKIKIISDKSCPKCGKIRERGNDLCFDCRRINHVFDQGKINDGL